MAADFSLTSGGRVVAVSRAAHHRFSKAGQLAIRLKAGLGIEGDAHAGHTVQHVWQRRRQPQAPNLRQVHLFPLEMLEDLRRRGFAVGPGDLGENVTTCGIDLIALPARSRLVFVGGAAVEVTGLRDPCRQLDRFAPGLMQALLDRAGDGTVLRKAGIMAIVIAGGDIRPGDAITVQPPDGPHEPLRPV